MAHEDVLEAHRRIAGEIDRTPVTICDALSERVGAQLFFKCENLQRTGAFKLRGAMNAVLGLDRSVTAVATHSSGNHGAALSYAAATRGLRAYIVVPEVAVRKKRAAIAKFGGEVIDCGPNLNDRETKLKEVMASTGAVFIPPYDDERIVAGQGTAALELMQEVADLDQIWVPVGGGGLASGTVWAAAESHVEVIGAEPELAKDAYLSLQAGRIVDAFPPATIADGLLTSLGEVTFGILHGNATRIFLASEEGIVSARALLRLNKLDVEPSSAVPLAAMLENSGTAIGRVGVILSGGNI